MSKAPQSRLGRGLSSLLGQPVAVAVPGAESAAAPAGVPPTNRGPDKDQPETGVAGLRMIAVEEVSPNRYQPRKSMDRVALEGLAASIRTSGVMQPIAVRPRDGGGYELIAGERRWLASKLAGLTQVPAIVSEVGDRDAAEWALVENVQREDLNPADRARALKALAERFGVSHGELAERLGLERSSVTNLIRLNELEAPIFGMIETGDLSVGHGKALLGMPAGVARIELASRAGEEEWPVRRLENAVRAALNPPAAGAESAPRTSAAIGDAERQLAEYLSTKVRIRTDKTGKRGKLVVEFFDLDHFDALMSRIGVRLRS